MKLGTKLLKMALTVATLQVGRRRCSARGGSEHSPYLEKIPEHTYGIVIATNLHYKVGIQLRMYNDVLVPLIISGMSVSLEN